MTDHKATIIRERKYRIAGHLYQAHHHLTEILWIHPNEAPVYLDYDQTADLRRLREIVDEILERHELAEEGLRAEGRRVA